MKVTVCQLDPTAAEDSDYLDALCEHTRAHRPDLLLLPEMPFSQWLAADPEPRAEAWQEAVAAHARRIEALSRLSAEAVLATRPIINAAGSYRNQAFIWRRSEGRATPVHEKYYLPNEEGYWEASWYERGLPSFDVARAGPAILGVLICTEMWFLERARHYGASGVDILCVPRASPRASTQKWLAGGRTAAVCSGSFCLSSNLCPSEGGAPVDGLGWIVDPEGEVLVATSAASPFATVEIDLEYAQRSKRTYPRYVAE